MEEKNSALEQENQHVQNIINRLNGFNDVLVEAGLESGEAAKRVTQAVDTLTQYQEIIDPLDSIDDAAIRQTQMQLTSFLIGTKTLLLNDVMSYAAQAQLPSDSVEESKDLRSSGDSKDLFDALIAMTNPGNNALSNHDDVFAKLDEIIKVQTDYTAQLSANSLTSGFSRLINSNEETRKSVSKLVDSTNQFAQSILPVLDHLQQQAENSQALLESNQKSIESSQKMIGEIEDTQSKTSARILRTQIGIDKTRQDMGMSPEFNTTLGSVDSGSAPDNGTFPEASNEDDYNLEP